MLGRTVPGWCARRADVMVRSRRRRPAGDAVVACAGLHGDELARASGADPGVRIVPFRGEYSGLRRARRRPGQGPGLPGARPGVPVPRGARHPRDRRQRARRAERRARAGPGGLLVGRGAAASELIGVAGLSRDAAAGAAALALRARRGAPVAVARGDGAPDPADAARRARRRPGSGRRRGAGAGGAGRTARLVDDFLFVAQGPVPGAVLHVLNAPSPAATAALPIGREILGRLTASGLDDRW